MKAREKLVNLTGLWLVHGVLSTALMFFVNGSYGFWSIVMSAIGLLIGSTITVLIGRALVNKNGFVRGFVALISGIVSVLGVLAIGKVFLLFFATWSFSLFWPVLMLSVLIGMNVHSLRVLFSRDVRRYFR